ncbi:hypothetical protein ACTXLT_09145 [Brachybacterium alimentarium]|uniref:hypothetical protein n=1 Tax=Brachybacterium alimentarium TaxID=47845 RepID=UPI00403D9A8E
MTRSIPMSKIVAEAAQMILEPPLPIDRIDRIDQIIAEEQAGIDARRAARAAEQETEQ